MNKIPKEIFKYGATGLALLGTIYILFYVITGYQKTINNHIEHSTDAWIDAKNVMTELRGSVDKNTEQSGRLESAIIRLEDKL